MLQLLFYLPSVILLRLSQVDLEFPLYALQLISVTILECPLLPVQDVLDITGDPGLVVREAAYSFDGDHNIHTEVQIVSSAVCDPLYVLTMCFLQDAPVSTFKAVPQSLCCLRRPFPEGAFGHGLSLDLWFILWREQDQVMVRLSQWGQRSGSVSFPHVGIQEV